LHFTVGEEPASREFFFEAMKYLNLPYLFVSVQLLSLALLSVSGPLLARSVIGLLTELTGLFLGLLAIYHMHLGNFNIIPVPKEKGKLVTTGIYSQLRHPMYLAQLLVFLPLVIESYSHFRLLVWFILFFDLVIKLHYEEKLLIRHFEGYRHYMKTTKRLIPFIY